MDNFSAHYTGIEQTPPPPNIRICGLPANSTSRYQPLNQGIIQNFKSYYRWQWLQFILHAIDNNQDPQSVMNIHLAIHWTLRSWNNDVSNTTIYNCFRKSTLISHPIPLPTPIMLPDMSQLYNNVIQVAKIHDSMAISNFLNPIEEEEVEEEHAVDHDEVLQEVLGEQLGLQSTQNDDDDEEQPSSQPVHTVQDAQHALKVLIEFTEGQEALPMNYLWVLECFKKEIEGIWAGSLVQGNLDRWIM